MKKSWNFQFLPSKMTLWLMPILSIALLQTCGCKTRSEECGHFLALTKAEKQTLAKVPK